MFTRTRVLALLCSLSMTAHAETLWHDPMQSDNWHPEGQAWPEETTGFTRLPDRAEGVVRDAVWQLSRHSAGLALRFETDATEVSVRYSWRGGDAMVHMPATGVSGLDLYRRGPHGSWQWVSGPRRPNAEGVLTFTDLTGGAHQEYLLMLSPYVHIDSLAIGIDDCAHFAPITTEPILPVVVWGTSIAQGACASRPGCMWTNRLRLSLDREIINLGFSGNGLLEPEVASLIAEVPAAAYVIDCMPNCAERLDAPTTRERMIAAVHTLREAHPDTPILLVEHAGYGNHLAQPAANGRASAANVALNEAVTRLREAGVTGLHLVAQADIGLLNDPFSTVDGIHPNDIGMALQANAVEAALRTVLREPVGDMTTTQPVTQRREPGSYHWHNRHREACTLARETHPDIVFLGDSITHNWGGTPVSDRMRNQASWDALCGERSSVNMGFGWDRVENMLWRIRHGALDGYQTEQIVILLGTNNLPIGDTDEAILAGLDLLLRDILLRQPDADILLLGLLPRVNYEARIPALNAGMAALPILAGHARLRYADIGSVLLNDDQSINRELMPDGLHPNAQGYALLAETLAPLLAE